MTDLFNGDPDPTPQEQPAPPQPQIPETLKDLVGEGKKYATVEAALASVAPAQAHISKLEEELRALREAQARAASVDDVRKTVEELLADRGGDPSPKLDEATVASLVTGLLSQREQEQKAEANAAQVKEALDKAFGDKASEQFGAAAKAAGLTREELTALARKSPAAALKLFDLKTPSGHSLNSDVRPEAFNRQTHIPEKKSVMFGAPTSAIIEQWRRAGELAKQKE